MSIYDLPNIEFSKLSKNKNFREAKALVLRFVRNKIFWLVVLNIFLSGFFGFLGGAVSSGDFSLKMNEYLRKFNTGLPFFPQISQKSANEQGIYTPQTSQEQLIITAVKQISPAVVSIVVTKNVPIIEQYFINPFQGFDQFFGTVPELQVPRYRQNGTEKKEVGGGTGFIVSDDGMVLTNKHVVLDAAADYTVFANDGKKYPAKVVARDPIQDVAILKIEMEKTIDENGGIKFRSFPIVKLGDSDKLQIGQTVIAIGNALGEFRNTVSVGVVSGLGRTISASGGGLTETLEDVIQTDAAINPGNSGGPLVNLKGEVVGINTAMVEQAQSIGFATPINKAKRAIEQTKTSGKIVYPFLGIRYVLINDAVKKENNLSVDYGVLIAKGDGGEAAITPGSAAEKSGLKENDIILEFNGEKITIENSLSKMIQKYNPGDKVNLKILRKNEEKIMEVVLGERSE